MTNASRKHRPSTKLTATGASPAADGGRTEDVVLVHGATDDGAYRVLRKRGDQLLVGEMRAVEEGKPLIPGGEVVALRPREDSAQLFDAETLFRVPGGPASTGSGAAQKALSDGSSEPASEPSTVGGGPAQVSTPAYREGWGAIFGSGRRRGGNHSLN